MCFPIYVCSRTIVLIALFSQYINKYDIPVPAYGKAKGGCYVGRFALFRLFPVSNRYWSKNLKEIKDIEAN